MIGAIEEPTLRLGIRRDRADLGVGGAREPRGGV